MICGGENGTNGCHFAGLSEFSYGENIINACHLAGSNEDVALAHHFVATHLPPPSYPIGVLLALAMPVKISKMVGNSASYSLNSWWIDRL